MPTDPALPRRAGAPTIPRPAPPSVQTTQTESADERPEMSDTSFGSLPHADVRQSLGAVGLVCRSVLICICIFAVGLALAAALAVRLLP